MIPECFRMECQFPLRFFPNDGTAITIQLATFDERERGCHAFAIRFLVQYRECPVLIPHGNEFPMNTGSVGGKEFIYDVCRTFGSTEIDIDGFSRKRFIISFRHPGRYKYRHVVILQTV